MKIWKVEEGFILDEEAPKWATKAAWRFCEGPHGEILVRAWVDEDNTQYQYLRGYSRHSSGVVHKINFFSDVWVNEAKVYAVLVEAEPMVCHDQWGFMTEEFRSYSQRDWDKMRNEVKAIIHRAIKNGVSPIAMKELLTSAVDCGTTIAMAEAKAESIK